MSEINERVIKTEYSDLMHKSYIDYAMSVIVARAIPDVRDGLKPVQRRILYDMHELGLKHDKPHRKSARIVGDTMGKYHPHGDSSIYDALVVLAQDFKKGVALVDGHGNFGSIAGDPPAASRYTESRLTQFAEDVFLSDLDKNVVDFIPNFDVSEQEPSILPVKLPNMLINGSDGIAVGMTTSTPPHNIGEVVDAMSAYIKNEDISIVELVNHLHGPDFPTGGIIANKDDLIEIYETGAGKIRLRGKVEIEELKGGKKRLIITEIPYTMIGAGIGKFLVDVAQLVEMKLTNDIVDISNQSSKDGIRIVIDLKKDANIEYLTNLLYKKTKLEDTFSVNMLAIADGRPETLNLKQIIRHNVHFQYEINTRKYQTLLKKEKDKEHIQVGLIEAVGLIDLIIEILRGSNSVKDAKACLMSGETNHITFMKKTSEKKAKLLHFTAIQAQAILDMKLQKLIGLELDELKRQHAETVQNINRYENILDNPDEMKKLILKELSQIKKKFAVQRKTAIENKQEVVIEKLAIQEQNLVALMDRFGYIRTIDFATYEKNKETIVAEHFNVYPCINVSKLCLFTNKGQMYQIKVSDIPLGKLRDKGVPIENISSFDRSKESMVFMCDERDFTNKKLLFVTQMGLIKQVDYSEYCVSKRAISATKLNDNDFLLFVGPVSSKTHIVLATDKSFFLKFNISDVPEKKRGAIGVRGIKLSNGDKINSVYTYQEGEECKIQFKNKELFLNRLKMAKRDGIGVKQR